MDIACREQTISKQTEKYKKLAFSMKTIIFR